MIASTSTRRTSWTSPKGRRRSSPSSIGSSASAFAPLQRARVGRCARRSSCSSRFSVASTRTQTASSSSPTKPVRGRWASTGGRRFPPTSGAWRTAHAAGVRARGQPRDRRFRRLRTAEASRRRSTRGQCRAEGGAPAPARPGQTPVMPGPHAVARFRPGPNARWESWSRNGEVCIAGLDPPFTGGARLASCLTWLLGSFASHCRRTHDGTGALAFTCTGARMPSTLAMSMAFSFDLALRDPKLIRERVRRRGGDDAGQRWPKLWLEGAVYEYVIGRDPFPSVGTPRRRIVFLAEEGQVQVPARTAAALPAGARRAGRGVWMPSAASRQPRSTSSWRRTSTRSR